MAMPGFYVNSGELDCARAANTSPADSSPQAQKSDLGRCTQLNGLELVLSCLSGCTVNCKPVLLTRRASSVTRKHHDDKAERICYTTDSEDEERDWDTSNSRSL